MNDSPNAPQPSEADNDWEWPYEEADYELECLRCEASVMEGYFDDAVLRSLFYCSLECLTADGHDPKTAYDTRSELPQALG